jgi:hypothetical protein
VRRGKGKEYPTIAHVNSPNLKTICFLKITGYLNLFG